MNTNTQELINVPVKEIAKQVRKELAETFPGIKFSVTSKRDNLNIDWTDGPLTEQVKPIAEKYQGRFFNSIDDSRKATTFKWQGQEATSYLEFIFCNRNCSIELKLKACEYFNKKYGQNVKMIEKGGGHTSTYRYVEVDKEYLFQDQWVSNIIGQIARTNTVESLEQFINELDPIIEPEEVKQEEEETIALVKIDYTASDEIDFTPVNIIDVQPEKATIIKAKMATVNKNCALIDYEDQVARNEYYTEDFLITRIVEFHQCDYDDYVNGYLMDNQAWIADFCSQSNQHDQWSAILIKASGRESFIIDPQGHKYARYVGLIHETIYPEQPTQTETTDYQKLYQTWINKLIAANRYSEIKSYDQWLELVKDLL